VKGEIMKMTLIVLLCVVVMGIVGCGPAHSSNVYSRGEAGKVQTVQEGEVLYVREVTIEGSKSPAGAIAGGILGYAVGNTIGGGSGKTLARAGGTVGGAAAGSAVQEKATREVGLEITVQLENSQVISVVQSPDETFDEGDRVRVLQRPDGTARVMQ
jgi:outer membrane lipoprotein SlyB